MENNNKNSLYVKPLFWSIISYTSVVLCLAVFTYLIYSFPADDWFDTRSLSRQKYNFVTDCVMVIIPFGCAVVSLFVGILTFCYGFFLVEMDNNEASALQLTPFREAKKILITAVFVLSLLGILFLVKLVFC